MPYSQINQNSLSSNIVNSSLLTNYSDYESELKATRKSFLLLLFFDLSFIGLIWLIYCTTKGYSLEEAYVDEIKNYEIDKSLFDVVILSLIRFIVLNFFYVVFKIKHWLPVAIITFASSSFLIAKVIIFAMKGTHKLITDYLVLILSFLIVWVQTWYLDTKIFSIIKKEASSIIQTNVDQPQPSRNYGSINDTRTLFSEVASFYSPMDSPNDSDEENNSNINSVFEYKGKPLRSKISRDRLSDRNSINQTSKINIDKFCLEYENLANDLISKVLKINYEQEKWKLEAEYEFENIIKENLTHLNEMPSNKIKIYTKQFDKIGKVFKLESFLPFNEALLLKVLRDEVEECVKWNITVKTSKIVKKLNENLSIIHVCVFEQAGGLVSPRDFVNLSKYSFCENQHVIAATACKTNEVPQTDSYVRGENGPTGYIFSAVNENICKITWILNVNLKGWLPQYLIDQSLCTVQKDFITSLIKYLNSIKN